MQRAIKELVSSGFLQAILTANPNATVLNAGRMCEVVIAFVTIALVVFAEHIAYYKNFCFSSPRMVVLKTITSYVIYDVFFA